MKTQEEFAKTAGSSSIVEQHPRTAPGYMTPDGDTKAVRDSAQKAFGSRMPARPYSP